MAWTTFTFKVITPLFSGDDPASRDDPIRVPSIRGVLRFWFRAVAAGRGVNDLPELWQQEEEVFGSTRTPSPIAMRLAAAPRAETTAFPTWTNMPARADFAGLPYLLGPGLWHPGNGLLRPFVAPNKTFQLGVRFSVKPESQDRVNDRFMYAFWAWLTFGGLGARTRRGFGQLRLTEVSGPVPGLWGTDILQYLTPPRDAADWDALGGSPAVPDPDMDDLDYHQWGALPADTPVRTPALPEHPTLAPPWWKGRIIPRIQTPEWYSALHRAGIEWRAFQLGALPERGLSTPEWKDAIMGAGTGFPRAALGLPVTYYRRADSQTGQTEFKSTVEADDDKGPLRRASPVWIRPVQTGDRQWQVFTHTFWARLLPEHAALRLTADGGNRAVDVPSDTELNRAWTNWMTGRPRLS